MSMRFIAGLALSASFVYCIQARIAVSDDEFRDLRLVRFLPQTDAELARAHRDAAGGSCEPIGPDQSLEQTTPSVMRSERDRTDAKNSRPAMRQSIFSVGLTMEGGDRNDLPIASRSRILQYLDENYVSIQVRVRRDLVESKLYFHHRPMAATVLYNGSRMTQPFQQTVTNAVREFRSIGLFTKSTDPKPEDLRTLVLVFKNQFIRTGGATTDQFEFVFIRGRDSGREDKLAHHVFVTSEGRTQLTYLNPYHRPRSPIDCGIRGSIVITDFGGIGGLEPRDSATRSYRLDAKRIFPMANIDGYCKSHDLAGGIYKHLDKVLDVLIDQMNNSKK